MRGSDAQPLRPEDVARVRGEGQVVRMRLERSSDDASFGQAEAGVDVTQGVAQLALGIVNAYLIGEAGGPWVLVDAGTPGNAEKIRAAAQERFGQGVRPEAIVLTHGHADHSGSAAELSDSWDVPVYAHRLELPFLTGLSAYPPPDPTVRGPFALLGRFISRETIYLGKERARELPAGREVPGVPNWRWIYTPGTRLDMSACSALKIACCWRAMPWPLWTPTRSPACWAAERRSPARRRPSRPIGTPPSAPSGRWLR
jgi:Metallo-beta-lactamase superfamily